MRRNKPRQLSKDALRRLEQYAWPGNVRELSNALERPFLYARTDALELKIPGSSERILVGATLVDHGELPGIVRDAV